MQIFQKPKTHEYNFESNNLMKSGQLTISVNSTVECLLKTTHFTVECNYFLIYLSYLPVLLLK